MWLKEATVFSPSDRASTKIRARLAERLIVERRRPNRGSMRQEIVSKGHLGAANH